MEYTERDLITRVLTIYHVELSQSTALEQKRFNSRSPAHRNLRLLLIWLTITLERSTSCQVIIVSLHITHITSVWYFTCLSGFAFLWYCKIPKISPGACIFQRPFLRGLYSEGLIYGGKFAFQNRLS